MEQIRNFGDERQVTSCVYCSGVTETRDHVPSKVFLDEPYPENVPVVPACESCNQGFSLDEEYTACLIECALAGSASPEDLQRQKIKRILSKRPALASRFSEARQQTLWGETSFAVESDRVSKVAVKLARGHAAFELIEPQREEPASVRVIPLLLMTAQDREDFESPPASGTSQSFGILPEVGSRAMQRLVGGTRSWIVVQPKRYRYLTSIEAGVIARMVLSEYLACEVRWE